MTLKTLMSGALAAALVAGPMAAAAPAQPKEMFIPLLVYRTGPYAPSGIPIANGFVDYFTLLNERDGGINGVKLAWEECETQYKTDLGVERASPISSSRRRRWTRSPSSRWATA